MSEITLAEVGERITMLVKNILTQVLDIITPILTVVAVAQIVFGVIAIAAGREWIGYRLIAGGGILLIVIYFVVPMLLSFL